MAAAGAGVCGGHNIRAWTSPCLPEEKFGEIMTWRERIGLDPAVLVGKPVIRGTRLGADLWSDCLVGVGVSWTSSVITPASPTRISRPASSTRLRSFSPKRCTPPQLPDHEVSRGRELPWRSCYCATPSWHDVAWVRTDAPDSSDRAVLECAVAESRITSRRDATSDRSGSSYHECAERTAGSARTFQRDRAWSSSNAAPASEVPAGGRWQQRCRQ